MAFLIVLHDNAKSQIRYCRAAQASPSGSPPASMCPNLPVAQVCHRFIRRATRKKSIFDEPQRVIPGHSAVFYDGDEVLGGGWIL
ncbi:aminomethyltransferase beta-barrel domain-containing protein [Acidicapsa dinghuensis]|uniref:Aminomethyltransferase beta-barrel domain-containing protein n=1 Tax=Acidicapsa dinghuensis TaxID=2218256 RepID=A0ABW1EIS5_9BACT|nr:aminomethyltransferase beta-barrel domain-containing protein [Acidicapsa dinghuensis]